MLCSLILLSGLTPSFFSQYLVTVPVMGDPVVTLTNGPEYESFGARRTNSFSHECSDTLPALSWIFLWPSNGQGHLLHGVTVEVGPEEFFEGCFAGEWGENLTEVGNVFGSGMRMDGAMITCLNVHLN